VKYVYSPTQIQAEVKTAMPAYSWRSVILTGRAIFIEGDIIGMEL